MPRTHIPVLLLLSALAALACGSEAPAVDPSAPNPAQASTTVPEIQPAHASEPSNLPPGHPPLEGASPSPPLSGEIPPGHPPTAGGIQPAPPGSGQGEAALEWVVPADWQAVAPSNSIRTAQYEVPGGGECVVYYFGPGQGGDPRANAERWALQFTQPDNSSSLAKMKTDEIRVAGSQIAVLLVEVTGTYRPSPMVGGSGEPEEGYMLLGAIAEGPDANWFFKLTGPETAVAAQREPFQSMIESLSRGDSV